MESLETPTANAITQIDPTETNDRLSSGGAGDYIDAEVHVVPAAATDGAEERHSNTASLQQDTEPEKPAVAAAAADLSQPAAEGVDKPAAEGDDATPPPRVDKEAPAVAAELSSPHQQPAEETPAVGDLESHAEAAKEPAAAAAAGGDDAAARHSDTHDSSSLTAKSSSGGAADTAPVPAASKPAAPAAGALSHPDDSSSHKPSKAATQAHKETAEERLTTPTAMRMLQHLQQTQGGKAEWHIASGVTFKSKQLSQDELSAMVDRLCTPKHAEDNLPPKPHAVKLAFEGGKETLVPVKEVSKEESIAYMSNLYERCQETRAKTKQSLEEKWLQPLIKPKTAAK